MDTIEVVLESIAIDGAPRKLTAVWTVEVEQKLCEFYGSRHIWKIHRCYLNADRATGHRKNYWMRQAARYSAMKRN
jgi:hypothetical protein